MRSLLSILTICALLLVVLVPSTPSQTYSTAELQKIAKTKNNVAKLAGGSQVKVIVRLEGGETLKGYVSSMGADAFTLETSQGPQGVPYFQVKEIHKKPSTGQYVAMVGLAGAAAVGILYGSAYLLSKCAPCME